MPKLWNETVDSHRAAVREAILETTAALVGKHGFRAVTMSRIAEETGIGRATLYKYFSDVESILLARHERQISAHLGQLAEARDAASGTRERLTAVLTAFASRASASRRHHDTELAALLHRDAHVARAEQKLHKLLRDLIAQAAQEGLVRTDATPDEMATYCLHALTAASRMHSHAAVHRLVEITLAGLDQSSESAVQTAPALQHIPNPAQ